MVVRRALAASVGRFSLFVLAAVLASSGFAQTSGSHSASSSSGVSFASAPAVSAGSHGVSFQSSGNGPMNGNGPAKSETSTGSGQVHHRHHDGDPIGQVYALPIPYPIAAAAPDDEVEAEDNDADYQGGPTIFDRRGSGLDSYVPPVRKVPTPHFGVSNAGLSVPDVPREPTLLIFKDGHKLEVENYAIVGANLVDLTPGHQRMVALADLDLGATRQQNHERGIIFLGPRQGRVN